MSRPAHGAPGAAVDEEIEMDKYTRAREISRQLCEVARELEAMQAAQDRLFIATGQVDHSTAPRFNELVAKRRELSAAWIAE